MSKIVTDGLLAYYNSKQGVEGNVWRNISPNTKGEYDGEIYGTTITENGLYFDGVDDYVDIPQLQDYSWTVGEKTIEAIFEPAVITDKRFGVVLGDTSFEILGYYGGKIITWLVSNDWDNYYQIEYPYELNIGETYHISISYNPPTGVIKLYLDGDLILEEIGTNNLSFNHPDYKEVTIGGDNRWGSFNGFVRSVRMYDRTLTDEEIHQNYLVGWDIGLPEPKPIVKNGLIAYWNSKRGIDGNTWDNIAPDIVDSYYIETFGTTPTLDGLYFDGVDDYAQIHGLEEFSYTVRPFTIEVLFSLKNWKERYNFVMSNYTFGDFISLYDVGGEYRISGFLTAPDWVDYLYYEALIDKTSDPMHVTLKYSPENNEFCIYLDGEIILRLGNVSDNLAINIQRYPEIYLGWTGSASTIDGYINVVRFYDRALSDNEVYQNYLVGGDIGLEEVETVVEDPPTSHLYMDGVDDYIIYNPMIAGNRDNRIEMEIMVLSNNGFIHAGSHNWKIHVDSGNRIRWTGDTVVEHVEINGIPIENGSDFTEYFGKKITLTLYSTKANYNSVVFAYNAGLSGWLEGNLYSLRVYSNDVLFVDFDTSKVNLLDGSGRGNNGELYGGTWIVVNAEPPIVNVISADKSRISNKAGMDRSNITFKFGFDQDVQSWEARVLGTDHETGVLAASGGFVSAGSEVVAEITWDYLHSQGENRINIYGQGMNGEWTPYDDNRTIDLGI